MSFLVPGVMTHQQRQDIEVRGYFITHGYQFPVCHRCYLLGIDYGDGRVLRGSSTKMVISQL